MSTQAARWFHGLTALVTTFALVASVVLTVNDNLAQAWGGSSLAAAAAHNPHLIVPVLAVLGWLAFRPRRRVSRKVGLSALVWGLDQVRGPARGVRQEVRR